ncbi:alpha-L-fucosidase C-terminal domain-containing protein [Bacteroidota bacterium]
MADWMKINKEAIFGTRPWTIYGEGPTKIKGGRFADNAGQMDYTSQDIRFTTKEKHLYAIFMDWPGEKAIITSLPKSASLWFGQIRSVTMLGISKPLTWNQDEKGMTVEMPNERPCEHAYVLKISGE